MVMSDTKCNGYFIYNITQDKWLGGGLRGSPKTWVNFEDCAGIWYNLDNANFYGILLMILGPIKLGSDKIICVAKIGGREEPDFSRILDVDML
jgi:hypothetical protein